MYSNSPSAKSVLQAEIQLNYTRCLKVIMLFCRYQASKDDLTVYAAISKPPSSDYVNVSRWYNHIDALLRISYVLPLLTFESCNFKIVRLLLLIYMIVVVVVFLVREMVSLLKDQLPHVRLLQLLPPQTLRQDISYTISGYIYITILMMEIFSNVASLCRMVYENDLHAEYVRCYSVQECCICSRVTILILNLL